MKKLLTLLFLVSGQMVFGQTKHLTVKEFLRLRQSDSPIRTNCVVTIVFE